MQKHKITKPQLKAIIENVIMNIFEGYHLEDPEEIIEYMWLRPFHTNLKVDIFVDDGGSYIRHNHIPLLLARNSYNKECDEFIPFALSDDPIILDDTIDYQISYNDIFDIQDFIKANLPLLLKLADAGISQIDFVRSLRIPSYVVVENKMILSEMATLRSIDSNLPMDVWLDENATYRGHAPRLKFRASCEQRTTREFSSMLLTNPPTIENLPNNSPLKKKDLEKLKNFVINNLDLLRKLADGEIDFTSEFLPNIKK